MSTVLDFLYAQADSQSITLPSGINATMREMTGLDQKILTTKGQAINGQSVSKVLVNCVLTLDDVDIQSLKDDDAVRVINGLLSADRKCLMFHLRRISLSDDFKFKTKCPECGQVGEWEIQLSDQNFPVKPYQFQEGEDGQPNKKVFMWESKVKSGLKFQAAFITGNDELRALKNRAQMNGLSDLEMRQLQIFDAENSKWFRVDPAKLPDKVITEIREVMKAAEGDQDDDVTVICNSCQAEVKFNLLGIADFMIPSVLS